MASGWRRPGPMARCWPGKPAATCRGPSHTCRGNRRFSHGVEPRRPPPDRGDFPDGPCLGCRAPARGAQRSARRPDPPQLLPRPGPLHRVESGWPADRRRIRARPHRSGTRPRPSRNGRCMPARATSRRWRGARTPRDCWRLTPTARWPCSTSREVRWRCRYIGHAKAVRGAAWSPDGRRIASASYDNTARIWDAATGKELHTLRGPTDSVQGTAWSLDSGRMATASGIGRSGSGTPPTAGDSHHPPAGPRLPAELAPSGPVAGRRVRGGHSLGLRPRHGE